MHTKLNLGPQKFQFTATVKLGQVKSDYEKEKLYLTWSPSVGSELTSFLCWHVKYIHLLVGSRVKEAVTTWDTRSYHTSVSCRSDTPLRSFSSVPPASWYEKHHQRNNSATFQPFPLVCVWACELALLFPQALVRYLTCSVSWQRCWTRH